MRGVVAGKKTGLLLGCEEYGGFIETEGIRDLLLEEGGKRKAGMDGERVTERTETEVAVEKIGIRRLGDGLFGKEGVEI